MSFCSDVYTIDKFVVTPETKKQWKKKGKEKMAPRPKLKEIVCNRKS